MPEPASPNAPFIPSQVAAPNATRLQQADLAETIEISVYLKPRHHHQNIDREELARRRTIDHADDIKRVRAFAEKSGLTVVRVDAPGRLLRLSGTVARMQAAFGTSLSLYEAGGVRFRGRQGTLHLPSDLHGIVQAVLGLDTRPAAQPRFVRASPSAAAAVAGGYLPNDVGRLYAFPQDVTGAGQVIALIELGGGYFDSDTSTAFAAMNLPPPNVTAMSVDGGQNAPSPDDGANTEVALDIQVAGGVAPGAAIVLYFAPNTAAGFADAITEAVHDTTNKPAIVSISWGSAEPNWTSQAVAAMDSALADAVSLNIPVFVASGDNLATDGLADGSVHVDFPAASSNAIGCGGTELTSSAGQITGEVVWNDGASGTGGGISSLFPVPAFQTAVTLPPDASTGATGRGVPDIGGNAAPASGYQIVVNGQTAVVGGTSAVAPLWAGLIALLNQKNGMPIGFFLPALYAQAGGAVRAITSGNNRPAGSPALGYDAGPGWNACTGLGVPNGAQLAALLGGPQVA